MHFEPLMMGGLARLAVLLIASMKFINTRPG